jgi:hypothetical protein
MKRLCHDMAAQTWGRRQLAVTALLRRAKVITDPTRLEYLNAQVAKRKARTEAEFPRTRCQPVS